MLAKLLGASRLLCVLVTPNSLKDEWVSAEWGAAWAQDIPILPVLLQSSPQDLPSLLRNYQAIDFHSMVKISDILNYIK